MVMMVDLMSTRPSHTRTQSPMFVPQDYPLHPKLHTLKQFIPSWNASTQQRVSTQNDLSWSPSDVPELQPLLTAIRITQQQERDSVQHQATQKRRDNRRVGLCRSTLPLCPSARLPARPGRLTPTSAGPSSRRALRHPRSKRSAAGAAKRVMLDGPDPQQPRIPWRTHQIDGCVSPARRHVSALTQAHTHSVMSGYYGVSDCLCCY